MVLPFQRLFARCTVLLCASSLVACTSLQLVADGTRDGAAFVRAQAAALKAGDEVVLTLVSGESLGLTVSGPSADFIQGLQGREPALVPLAKVQRIERREVDAGRTTLVVLAVLAVIVGLRQYAKGVSKLTNP